MGLAGLTMECSSGALSNRLVERRMETSGKRDALEVAVSVTRWDWARWYWWVMYRSRGAKVALAISAVIALLLGLAATGAPTADQRADYLWLPITIAGWWIVGVPILGVITAARGYATHASLREPLRFSFSAEGVAVESASVSAQQRWPVYWKAVETGGAFHLYVASAMAQTLPKRCFTSAEQMQRFREIVRAGMGERAKGIRG
jgi:hypothetical protein